MGNRKTAAVTGPHSPQNDVAERSGTEAALALWTLALLSGDSPSFAHAVRRFKKIGITPFCPICGSFWTGTNLYFTTCGVCGYFESPDGLSLRCQDSKSKTAKSLGPQRPRPRPVKG